MATSTPYEVLVESAASLTDTELIVDIDDADLSTASAIVDRNVPRSSRLGMFWGRNASCRCGATSHFIPSTWVI